eukprot:4136536-Prymnesium_polylepis.1
MFAGLAVPMYPTSGERPFGTFIVEKPCDARYLLMSFSPFGKFSFAPLTSARAASGSDVVTAAAAACCSTLRLHSPSPRGGSGPTLSARTSEAAESIR